MNFDKIRITTTNDGATDIFEMTLGEFIDAELDQMLVDLLSSKFPHQQLMGGSFLSQEMIRFKLLKVQAKHLGRNEVHRSGPVLDMITYPGEVSSTEFWTTHYEGHFTDMINTRYSDFDNLMTVSNTFRGFSGKIDPDVDDSVFGILETIYGNGDWSQNVIEMITDLKRSLNSLTFDGNRIISDKTAYQKKISGVHPEPSVWFMNMIEWIEGLALSSNRSDYLHTSENAKWLVQIFIGAIMK